MDNSRQEAGPVLVALLQTEIGRYERLQHPLTIYRLLDRFRSEGSCLLKPRRKGCFGYRLQYEHGA
jgi:hypothetical protein